MNRYLIFTFCALLLAGCATQKTEVVTPSFDQQLKQPTVSYVNGSLWQGGAVPLAEDSKARRLGDIVTIMITETASASKQAATATGRSSSMEAGISNLLNLEKSNTVLKNFADLSKLLNAENSSKFDGSGSTSRKETLTATISVRVVEVLPNGNLRIEGRRNVKVNNEDQLVMVKGTVRQRDITPENTINSSYVADAQIVYSGDGVISDRQKPGWLMNILDNIWPF